MNAMTDDPTRLTIRREFDAPPQLVFDAWLEREQWQAWIGPEGTTSTVPLLEPHVGGRYRVEMTLSDGRVMPVSGQFQAIEPPHRLAFTWGWDNDSGRQSLVTLSFEDLGGRTAMTLSHDGLGTIENRDGHGKGWNSALNKLAAYLAGGRVPLAVASR